MISVYLQGGLGNQLFQIFTTIAYSLKHNIVFKLPSNKNDLTSPYGEIYKRPLYFDNFLKNFDSYKKDILRLTGVDKLLHKETNNNTISIHFRIGDYVHNTSSHPILSIDYYVKSLQHIIEKTNKDNWNVSYYFEKKDLVQVTTNIRVLKDGFPNLNFKECPQNLSDWEEMLSMSSCKHNIIANSTFSWWGAYLNENNDKIT